MKRVLFVGVGFLILSLVAVAVAQAKTYKIGLLMWQDVSHDRDAIAGFKEGMELSGIAVEFDLKIANEDKARCTEFVRKWKAENVDLILTVGTKATLLTLKEINDIPVVFTAVTNPVMSGISDSWLSSGRNVTGSSNWIMSKTKLQLFKESVLHLKTLGVIYNPDNPVSMVEVTEVRQVSGTLGITLKEASIAKVDQIEKALEGLISQKIDALWVPIEKMIYTNMDHVGRVTIRNKLPVVSSTLEAVEITPAGASVGMVGVTIDYKALGRRCVHPAVEILTSGKDPKKIPINTIAPLVIANINAASAIDYQIPPIFLANTDRIIRGFAGQKIVIAGTGDNQVLIGELAKALKKKLGGGEIEVPDSIGSTGGIKALAAGRIELARVARPLRENEIKYGFTYQIFARSPVVFAVHPSVTGIDNLKTEEIIGIYSGKINNWGVLGAEPGKIYAATRESGDSSLEVLRKNLPGFKKITTPVGKILYSTSDTITAVIRHRNTIGFMSLSEIKGTDLRVMKLDGIYPLAENINSGKYKLVSPFGIVYKGELTGLARAFVDFLYSVEGKKIITEFGAVPSQ